MAAWRKIYAALCRAFCETAQSQVLVQIQLLSPRAGSPIRRLPSRGRDLLRGKRAPVGGESCGYRNGLHETTMALLYTRGIKGAPAIACRRGVIGNHAEKGRHLLSVQVRILPSAPVARQEQCHCLHLHRQVKPSRWGFRILSQGGSLPMPPGKGSL